MVIQEQKQSLREHHLGMIWVLTSEAAASTYQPAHLLHFSKLWGLMLPSSDFNFIGVVFTVHTGKTSLD